MSTATAQRPPADALDPRRPARPGRVRDVEPPSPEHLPDAWDALDWCDDDATTPWTVVLVPDATGAARAVSTSLAASPHPAATPALAGSSPFLRAAQPAPGPAAQRRAPERRRARAAVAAVRWYQRRIGATREQPCCRLEPSCSAYAVEALSTHGTVRGSLLTAGRVLRCRPGGPTGADPVPR